MILITISRFNNRVISLKNNMKSKKAIAKFIVLVCVLISTSALTGQEETLVPVLWCGQA